MEERAEGSYRAYMLRLWRAEAGPQADWRASLEDVRTGERHGFASLKALLAWLRAEAAGTGAADEPSATPPKGGEAKRVEP